ncbi:MAG: hypothetical protein JWN66_3560 [Sphingomonas bacterium]|uniref:DUF2339 domain-containing protein n=1 Tax=Sphingomonas bacterium TaxID=1895847 RepID=UPI00260E158D|nr:DUF2339 domain-containing protein [Sphingomonas bacterium]MDB5706444.1 hypothetical protein [Sphingomonas bacterium]
MTFILFIAVIVLGVVLSQFSSRIRLSERRIIALNERLIELEFRLRAAAPESRYAAAAPEEIAPDEPGTLEPEPRTHEQVFVASPPPAIDMPAIDETEAVAMTPAAEDAAAPERGEREPIRIGFESIVGGKLPIWIGGAALVLAAFFLVRYSIENGLLGPKARTIIAGLFGLVLVAASEVARRLPATRDDPRIGQALAGAGVASLYGTLYIAAEIYHLIGAGSAFAIMVAVTVGGLGLALRHGPPTAIMALIGGFAAPIVSGFDAANVGPLLVYLGLLVAALFGLAIRRGWVWLALAACGGGFAWANILVAAVSGEGLAGVGGFVVLMAIGATLALPRTGTAQPLLRLLPMVAGLVQLLVLAPALDFGPLAWGLYLLLSAAALWLAWRDEALAPGAAAALVLVLGLLGVALDTGERVSAPLAAIAITALFGASGHLFARRGPIWAGMAIGATAGPVILTLALAHGLLPAAGWAGLLALAALAAAALSWRERDLASDEIRLSVGLAGGAAAAALLFGLAEVELIAEPWRWPAWLVLGVALAAWSRRMRDAALGHLALVPIAVTGGAMAIGFGQLEAYLRSIALAAPMPALADLAAIGLLPALLIAATAWLLAPGQGRTALDWIALGLGLAFIPALLPAPWHTPGLALATAGLIQYRRAPRLWAVAAGLTTLAFAVPLFAELLILMGGSLAGNRLPWLDLPPLVTILRELTLSAALIGAALFHSRALPGRWRSRAIFVLAGVATITVYALAKAPLAIATLPRFETLGLLERVAITQLLFAAAWAAARWRPDIGRVLLILALGRFVWFDLLILDPVIVPQSVGPLPLLNLATLDAALVAAWLWRWRGDRLWRAAMLAAVFIAVAATVRQAVHGDLLTGGIGRTENWLYSAAFLGLSLVWLAHGIRTGLGDLRIAGLGLLTAVTLKVFLIDAAALEGILRILSFLGLGLALIGIGWAYGRIAAPAQSRST